MKLEAISKTAIEAKLLALAERLVQSEGFRVVDVDCFPANRSLVRVFIERETRSAEQSASPSIDDCARVSQLLGPALEVEDFVAGAYDLEVSSPGLDRRLRLQKDFEEAVGRSVQVRLHEAIEGLGQKPKGTLLEASGGRVKLDISGTAHEMSLANIRRANVIWDASEGKGKKKPGGKGSKALI